MRLYSIRVYVKCAMCARSNVTRAAGRDTKTTTTRHWALFWLRLRRLRSFVRLPPASVVGRWRVVVNDARKSFTKYTHTHAHMTPASGRKYARACDMACEFQLFGSDGSESATVRSVDNIRLGQHLQTRDIFAAIVGRMSMCTSVAAAAAHVMTLMWNGFHS